MTESDIDREKRHRNNAKSIVDSIYAIALDYEQLRAERDLSWITDALWKELLVDDQRFLTESMFKSAVPRLLEGLERLYAPGGVQTAPERLATILSDAIGMHGHDPSFATGIMAGFRNEIDAIARRPPRVRTAPDMIRRLLAEAKSPLPDQAPAIQCLLVLRGMASAIEGSLSETPEGGLRLLSPTGEKGAALNTILMVEQFFDYHDVLMVAARVDVKLDHRIYTT